VVQGVNTLFKEQKDLLVKDQTVTVNTYTFDDKISIVAEDIPLTEIKPLTLQDYVPNGNTALRDAMAHVFHKIKNDTTPDVVHLFVIQTDGEENSSSISQEEFNQIRDASKAEIIYLGMGEKSEDAMNNGRAYGAHRGATLTYGENNILDAIHSLGEAVKRYRSGSSQKVEFTPVERGRSSSCSSCDGI